jgi:hypothetical protein
MRYFIIFYTYNLPGLFNSGPTLGELAFINSTFPNRLDVLSQIQVNEVLKNASVVFTNIIELSEEDFNNWNEVK